MMVARFYYPRLRKQIIFLPIVSFIIGLLSIVTFIYDMKGLFVIASLLLGACYVFSPLIFTTRKGLEIETMLPATWVEKSVFIIGYCLIGVLMLYFVPITIAELVAHTFMDFSYEELLARMMTQGIMYKVSYNVVNTLFYLVTCMTAVTCSTRYRAVKGILWVIASNIIFFIVGVVEGIMVASHTEWGSPEDIESSTSTIIRAMDPVFDWLIVIMIAAIIGLITFTVHKIKTRQI